MRRRRSLAASNGETILLNLTEDSEPLPMAETETGRVTSDPDVYGGRPCIRGLRISVADILDMLAAGATREDVLRDYPYLEDGDITAALQYGARQSNHPLIQTS
jgi:uncharacterized protein (DUF433 family)